MIETIHSGPVLYSTSPRYYPEVEKRVQSLSIHLEGQVSN